MSVPRTDVIVVGGGVIGCAIADAIAARGIKTVLLESHRVAHAASAGAAGLLAPLVEAPGPGPFLDLALAGRALFRDEAAALRRDTGIDIGYRESGTLRVAESAERAAELRARVGWQRERGLDVRWLSAAEVEASEPALRNGVDGALLSADDHQVISARLANALAQRATARGAWILEGVGVEYLLSIGERAPRKTIGVRTSAREEYRSRYVVLATGASRAAPYRGLPVRPVKGQLVHLRPARPVIGHPIFADGVYLAPKADGRVVVGATEEDAGYDIVVSDEVTAELVGRACALVPALRDSVVDSAWAGLRPATPDRLPVIGLRSDTDGVIFATGHFRNGVLLSLITGRIVAALVGGERPPVDIAAFSPDRFV